MAKVVALFMDTITKKSNHQMVPCAVSVCLTPAAPSPLPIPYPVVASIAEGITDPPMRTKFDGAEICTVGSCFKKCHGNEPGTLKEVVSLNTAGPCFLILGAINVFVELGMAGITLSPGFMNKCITVGAGASASGAGGASGGGGAGGGPGGSAGDPSGPSNQSGGGGDGGGSNTGASQDAAAPGGDNAGGTGPAGTSSGPTAEHTCQNGHPVDVVSGCVVDEATDVELPGLVPLVWKRTYSSARAGQRSACLGPGWAHSYDQRINRDGNVLNFRDEEGRRITFEHVGEGHSTFHRRERAWLHGERNGYRIEKLQERRIYHFERFDADDHNATAWLTRIEDKYGNALRLAYDHGKLAEIIDTAGRRLEVRWKGNKISELNLVARGRRTVIVSYIYSEAGCLTTAFDRCRHAEKYEYDQKRRMTAAVIKTGVKFEYEYDDTSNRCIRTWGPKGLYRVPLQYDVERQQTAAGGEEPRIYHWNSLGRMTRETTPSGIVIADRAFDEDGYLIASVDGAGEGMRYWYDELGNTTRIVGANDQVTAFEYAYGRPTKRTTPDGLETHYQYDRAGELVGMRMPSGASFSIHRDERGRTTAVDGPLGRLVAYEYDAESNIVAEWNGRGEKTTHQYDELGRRITRTDPLNHQTNARYDAMGRRTAVMRPDGTAVRFSYDALGQVTERTDDLGRTWQYEYRGMGVMTRMVDPDGREWKLDYTSFERLRTVTNPTGEQYSFAYDDAGRIVSETAPDGRQLHYHYDQAGEVSRVDYDEGAHRAFRYDESHRLLGETACDGSHTEYQRDAIGRLAAAILRDEVGQVSVSFERDALGQVIAERQDGRALLREYDVLGRCSARTLPDGTRTQYAYDCEDTLTALEHAAAGCAAHRLDFERDAAGRATSVHASAAERRRFTLGIQYDAMGRMVEQRVDGASPSHELRDAAVMRRYNYDGAGRVTHIDDKRWGTTNIAYDGADRLLSYLRGEHHERYEYDRAGNIAAALHKLEKRPKKDNWELSAGNRLMGTAQASYEYDGRGRRVKMTRSPADAESGETACTTYEWDSRDQLRSVGLPDGGRVAFRYDALGRRTRKDTYDQEGTAVRSVHFLWDGDHLCAEMTDSETRSFVHHPKTGVPLLQAERGAVFTYVCDQVGVPKELIDTSGAVAWAGSHSAWGKLLASDQDEASRNQRDWAVETPFRLLGQYFDEETELAYTRFRYFDPETARWLSPDPIGLAGGDNLYGFNGSPTHYRDALGLTDGGNHGPRTEPMDLQEQMAMQEAKGGAGEPFMNDRVNDPRYKDTHDKMRHNHDHGDGTKTEIHYWRDRETGETSGHKFKDAPDNAASRSGRYP